MQYHSSTPRLNLESVNKAVKLLNIQTSELWFDLGINQIEANFDPCLTSKLRTSNQTRQDFDL